MSLVEIKKQAALNIAEQRETVIGLSRRIHANPEVGYEEVKASLWLAEALADIGFSIEAPYCGLTTAFRASIGSGKKNFAFLAEYDALPGIGHACGHNIIAAASFAAAAGLASLVDDLGITITVLGTPAEEILGKGGKILMLERGAFSDVDAALMVHPTPFEVAAPRMIAATNMEVQMRGKSAHASAAPQKALNAADALTVAQVALGLLRQHIDPDVRISGITTYGGEVANVIPAKTEASYVLRAPGLNQLATVRTRVEACFQAGALATGCTVDLTDGDRPYGELCSDPGLVQHYLESASALGRDFKPDENSRGFLASSDVGNVSQVIPTIQPFIGLGTWPIVNHQPEFAQACATKVADQATLDGGTAMAWTVAAMVAASDSPRPGVAT
jgi:amidohydrolase